MSAAILSDGLSDQLITRLKNYAKASIWTDSLQGEDDYLVVDDYAGGNVDDAFYCGETAGEVVLARQVLAAMGIDWNA